MGDLSEEVSHSQLQMTSIAGTKYSSQIVASSQKQ